MSPENLRNRARRVAAIVDAYETAFVAGGASIDAFVPESGDDAHRDALVELIRVEMERLWSQGQPRYLADYCGRYPELANDREMREAVAFEEQRLAQEHGEATLASMPRVGEDFEGFRLLAELGRGAFAAVFLAKEGKLANRYVVLKISAQFVGESQMLAHLQHTNVVPIYSIHHRGPLHAICMPFLGATTLAEVLRDLRADKTLPRSGVGLQSTIQARDDSTVKWARKGDDAASIAPSEAAFQVRRRPAADERPWEHLARWSYVEAVLWLFARLADGLWHAHQRGVVHRDLKPANILLRDDGEPMLLDFNLSAVESAQVAASDAVVGGTLPYMAPEQIRAIRGDACAIDGRADVYAVGIILYEMLTGRLPFAKPESADDASLAAMLEDRAKQPTRPAELNRQVSPAAQAIVERCLALEPERRYRTAKELYEDLSAHLAHRPLRHAAEPSRRERLGKWARRHPRLASATSVGALAVGVLLAVAFFLARANEQLARHAAEATRAAFNEDYLEALFLLDALPSETRERSRGLKRAQDALARYGVEDHVAWETGPLVQSLAAEDQTRLRGEIVDLLLAMSHTARSGDDATAQQAEKWATRATQLDDGLSRPQASDRIRDARRSYQAGQFDRALEVVTELLDRQPQNVRLWLLKGRCNDALLRHDDAAVCYTIGTVLRPQFAGAYVQRGLCRFWKRDYARARDDFDRAIELAPQSVPAIVNRALARQHLGEYEGALADVNRAIAIEPDRTRLYYLRARLRRKAGDSAGATSDESEGMRHRPSDVEGWIARGVFQLQRDSEAALADFDAALSLDGRSFVALQNKAHVLSERLNRPDEAIEALDNAIELYPELAPAVAGRGVLHARQGRRELAVTDARRSLALDRGAAARYQAACIYALTSRKEPGDAAVAIKLLAAALDEGFGRDLIDQDADLDPIRSHPEFPRLTEAVSFSVGAR